MTDQTQAPPRTAAATAAAMRRAEERRAEYLRERGWECIPPDGVMRLTAIARPAADVVQRPHVRVEVVGPPAAGGKPRANTDGRGARLVAAFYTAGQLPRSPQHREQFERIVGELLAAQGFTTDGAWTLCVDPGGPYACVPAKRAPGR